MSIAVENISQHIDSRHAKTTRITTIIRSLGIIPIFLPAYCPFFNPIELIFGYVKARLQRVYLEGDRRNSAIVIGEVFNHFSRRCNRNIFRKCGYVASGRFSPTIALKNEVFNEMDFYDVDN